MKHHKMNWRLPGYVHETHKIIETIHRTRNNKMAVDLRGAAHYFKIFTMGLDMCAICQKPRSEHPRAPR